VLKKKLKGAETAKTTEELRGMLDPARLPRHVAIIMDGNGRWATRRGLPRIAGHKKGADTVRRVSDLSARLGIEVLTLYAFSDENWGRPTEEVSFLMDMLVQYLQAELATMQKNGLRFRTIGRTDRLPQAVQEWIARAKAETAGNAGMTLNLALSYGGRGEIIEAVKRLLSLNGAPREITEQSLTEHLDTAGLPDPDLIIRTSGERRISNFLLWQAAYAELYFTDTLWPDFEERDLLLALLDFQRRERRFGLTSAQTGQR
jgi:undecaprenyl diphosphate synthase